MGMASGFSLRADRHSVVSHAAKGAGDAVGNGLSTADNKDFHAPAS